MKTLAFVHDHVLVRVHDKVYTSGGLSDQVLERYLYSFDKLVVICRVKDMNDVPQGYEEIMNENISFSLIQSDSRGFFTRPAALMKQLVNNLACVDAVVVRLPSILGVLVGRACLKTDFPLLVEVVADPFTVYWYHNALGKVISLFMKPICSRMIKSAKFVIYVTDVYLQKKYPTLGESIACSDVVLPDFDTEKILHEIHVTNISNKYLKLGTIGPIDIKYKGQADVIKAIGLLKKQNIKINYYLIGSGDSSYLKKICKKYGVEEQVKFLGRIDHSKIFDWFKTINLYVQPSLTEGLPRSIVEAMSVGCASIGSRVGGIPELVGFNQTFKKSNYKNIATLLQTISPNKLKDISMMQLSKAINYRQDTLNERRNMFLSKFANYVDTQ